jgi:hypothetical protein
MLRITCKVGVSNSKWRWLGAFAAEVTTILAGVYDCGIVIGLGVRARQFRRWHQAVIASQHGVVIASVDIQAKWSNSRTTDWGHGYATVVVSLRQKGRRIIGINAQS